MRGDRVVVSSFSRKAAGFGVAALVALAPALPAAAQDTLPAGAGFMTRFSGVAEQRQDDGTVRSVIDTDGASGIALDLARPGHAPDGSPWRYPPDVFSVTAGDTGQVFGVALDDAPGPNIYVTATSAFGLHRNADNSDWMAGMWGADGGPGTVYRLTADNGYRPSVFAQVTLDGRGNSGAALGNIAYDRWNRQFFVSDLETGMIHRLRLADGFDAGYYDHGGTGRTDFVDAATGERMALSAVGFDPGSSARIADCPSGDFARDPSCWNVADFRRRVWGLSVRRDTQSGEIRLYYAVWGSQGFGNPEHAAAGDDARNSVWSVALAPDGDFDTAAVRREFILPDFFRSPEAIARAGVSHPVADIAFADYGDQTVMLLAERGGLRNRGLDAENSFAFPREARVLRYALGTDGTWQPEGRYDIGYNDRQADGPPYLRAGAAGGVAFGMGHDASGSLQNTDPDAFVWMTGDGLCTAANPCPDGDEEVHGLQGNGADAFAEVEPAAAFQPYPAPGPATPPDGPDSAYMIDADLGAHDGNDATRIGDIAIHQTVPRLAQVSAEGPWYGSWSEDWPPIVPEREPGEDLPPPPTGEQLPEIGIAKTTPPWCDWGAECSFLLTITNNGPGVYEGPLVVFDHREEGAFTGASPGWDCGDFEYNFVTCRSGDITLGPGESAFLQLTFAIPPAIGPLPEWEIELQNCGIFIWPGSATPEERIAAVEVALFLHGLDPGPRDGIYDAALQAAIDTYRIDNSLPPGGIDDELYNSLYPGSSGLAGDADPGNELRCVPYYLPGEEGLPPPELLDSADLKIEKTLVSPTCSQGMACEFNVRISNAGGVAFSWPLVFGDVAGMLGDGPLDAATISPATAGVECTPEAGGQRCFMTGLPVVDLAPGAGVDFAMTVDVPTTVDPTGTLRNCAVIHWGAMGTLPVGLTDDDWNCADVALLPAVLPAEGIDLEIAKGTTAETCYPGEPCNFYINARNVGTADYTGPLFVRDIAEIVTEGRLPDGSVRITSGGECAVFVPGGPTDCLLATEIDLPAGGPWQSFTFVVDIPADTEPGLDMRNCASLYWEAMDYVDGRDDNPGNDEGLCIVVPIGGEDEAPPEDEEPILIDLEVTKQQIGGDCTPGGECGFEIFIRNIGTEDFEGRLAFNDFAQYQRALGGGAVEVGHLPPDTTTVTAADVDCVLSAAGPDCISTDPIVLEAGGPPVHFTATGTVPEDADFVGFANCAQILWTDMDLPGDGNDSNDTGCVVVELEGTAPISNNLSLRKHGPGACERGEPCRMWFGFVNWGPGVYEGPLAVGETPFSVDDAGVQEMIGMEVTGSRDDDWSCRNAFPALVECINSAGVTIGERETHWVEVDLAIPEDFPTDLMRDRATIRWDLMEVSGDADGSDNDASAYTPITDEPVQLANDFAVTKEAPEYCLPGDECTFRITVTNNGPNHYLGSIDLDEWLARSLGGIDMELIRWEQPRWECAETDLTARCRLPHADLSVGEPTHLHVTVRVPADMDGEDMQNCARLAWRSPLVEGDADDGNDQACAFTRIGRIAEADLEPGGGTECVRGESCELDVTINNRGDAHFDGAAGLRGAFDPAVTVESVAGETPGLLCGVTGDGAYECLGSALSIKPGDAARIKVFIFVPADFGPDTIRHTKDMVWPDAVVKDRNPDNDQHVSDITILDPETPPEADLAIAKTANQGSCTAGRECRFSLTVTNNGPADFEGSIAISDTIDPASTRLTGSSPGDWDCRGGNGNYGCTLEDTVLAAGQSRSLALTFTTRSSARGTLTNCAQVGRGVAGYVADVQQALTDAGFDAGPVDGIAGRLTRTAVTAYQQSRGMAATGEVDAALLDRLLGVAVPADPVAENDNDCASAQLIAPPAAVRPVEPEPVQPEPVRPRPVEPQPVQPQPVQPVQPPTVTPPPAVVERPTCPSGWAQVGPAQAAIAVAQGKRVMPVSKGGITIMCVAPRAQPPATQGCPQGTKQVTRTQAKALVNQGYEILQVGNLLCARPR